MSSSRLTPNQPYNRQNHAPAVQSSRMAFANVNRPHGFLISDFDHYIIRPEASRVLAELASYLKSNVGAQVEIYAFADDRGSNSYNFELTQKRGEAVVADWRIIAKLTGISEGKLKNLNGATTETVKAFQPIRLPINAKSISDELFYVGIQGLTVKYQVTVLCEQTRLRISTAKSRRRKVAKSVKQKTRSYDLCH